MVRGAKSDCHTPLDDLEVLLILVLFSWFNFEQWTKIIIMKYFYNSNSQLDAIIIKNYVAAIFQVWHYKLFFLLQLPQLFCNL